jgi:Domain of unknown function (DUF4440)
MEIKMQDKYMLFRVIFLTLSITFFFSEAATASSSKDTLRQELLALDNRMDTAFYTDPNPEILKQVLANNFVYVHSGAQWIQTKTDVLKTMIPKGAFSLQRGEKNVRVQGDTANISGFCNVKTKSATLLKYHIQRVYVYDGDSWKLVTQHVAINLREEGLYADVMDYIYQNYWSKQIIND